MDHDIRKSDIISAIWMGAFVGCFIILLIMVIDAYIEGPDTYLLPGRMIINSFYFSIKKNSCQYFYAREGVFAI